MRNPSFPIRKPSSTSSAKWLRGYQNRQRRPLSYARLLASWDCGRVRFGLGLMTCHWQGFHAHKDLSWSKANVRETWLHVVFVAESFVAKQTSHIPGLLILLDSVLHFAL